MAVYEGFPKEPDMWRVYAKLPASRTSSVSTERFSVAMSPQGIKTPDYGSKNYKLPEVEPGQNNYSFEVSGDDIAELYERYQDENVGYAVFEVDGHMVPYEVHLRRDGEEPFTYRISIYIDPGFAYAGTAKIHLNSTGENGLKSTNISASGNWYMGVL